MGEVHVTALDQIPPGEGRSFRVAGREIAVFRTHDGEAFATQAHCPHLNGPLADGLVGGATILCPLHDRLYDLRTGCGLTHEHMTIAIYPVRIENGEVWMSLTPAPQPAPAA